MEWPPSTTFVGNQTFIFVFARVPRLFAEGNHPEDGTVYENVNIPETLRFHSLSMTVHLTAARPLITINSWVQRMPMGVKLNWLSICAEGIVLGPFLRRIYFYDISIGKHELEFISIYFREKHAFGSYRQINSVFMKKRITHEGQRTTEGNQRGKG